MHGIALVARLLLAIVFAAAAAGKLADRPGTRRALADFGLPARAIPSVSLLLPLAELATAVALVARPSARWGAIAAVCLLAVFIVAIARAMSRGEAPDCHCFGQLASGLAGRSTLIRNVLLAVPAVLVVAYGPGEGIDQWVSGHSAAELGAIAAGLCAAILAVVVARLWPENRRLRRELGRMRVGDALLSPGLPVGAPAPGFSLPSADGAAVSLAALLGRGRPVALVFVGPDCSSCTELLPDLARWQTTLAERITIALLTRGSVRESRAMAERYGLESVLVQEEGEVSKTYRARATPSVVIVAPDGRIASRTYQTRMMTEAVVRNALHIDHAPLLRVVTVSGDAARPREAVNPSPVVR
jgi:peroxiredoxin/uncharacterized membrane protein YphA (DoxX/SURF4 family)